jgi:hypothetical protein
VKYSQDCASEVFSARINNSPQTGSGNTVARRFRRLSDDGQIYRQALEAALKKLKNEK